MIKIEQLESRRLLAVTTDPAWVSTGDVPDEKEVIETGRGKIVGGEPADSEAWPGMVSLQSNGHFCGGTLISQDVIVTAAHCVAGADADRLSVVVGRHDLSTNRGNRIGIRETIVHEQYDPFTNDADIALLFLENPTRLEPLPLVDTTTVHLTEPGSQAVALGWGATREGAFSLPDRLRQVTVPIVSNSVANGRFAYDGQVTSRMLPAGLATGGQDTCQGDSGGPLLVSDEAGQHYLAGITSWGAGCANPNKYGIYVRISSFADWIREHSGLSPHGRVRFGRSQYGIGETIDIFLSDADLSGSPSAAVQLASSLGDREQVVLREMTSGRFRGEITLAAAPVDPENGWLEVRANTILELSYDDADNGSGMAVTTRSTARVVRDDFANGPGGAQPITAGDTLDGEIELSGDEDWFRLSVSADMSYRFEALLTGSLDDSVITLYDETGTTRIAQDDDSGPGFASQLQWHPDKDQVVHLAVRAYAETVGSYGVRVTSAQPQPDDHGNRASDATVLALNRTAAGEIETPTDVDWFALPVSFGVTYQFETHLTSISDTVLRLVGEDGISELAFNDDFQNQLASQIVWNAGYTGTVYVEVSGFGEFDLGRYALNATPVDTLADDHGNFVHSATEIVSHSVEGAIDYEGDVDVFSFAASAGGSYTLTTELLGLDDSVMRLLDNTGQQLAVNDDAPTGDTFASRIEWTAPVAGHYFVEVTAFANGLGNYRVHVQGEDHGNSALTATRIDRLPWEITATLDRVDDRDWFRFDATSGAAYHIETQLGGVRDTALRLWAADGETALAFNDDNGTPASTIVWQATEDGPLFVEVSAFGTSTGEYRVAIRVPYGDANLDGTFDSADLVKVFQAGQYDDRQAGNSTWATGDWNGDQEFDSADLVAAFAGNQYETNARAARSLLQPVAFQRCDARLWSAAVERVFAEK